jgi:hypothetical protein
MLGSGFYCRYRRFSSILMEVKDGHDVTRWHDATLDLSLALDMVQDLRTTLSLES